MPPAIYVTRGDFCPKATVPENPLFCVPTLPPIDTELSAPSFHKDSVKPSPNRRKQYNLKFKCQILNKMNLIRVVCPDISQRQLAKLLKVPRESLA